MKRIFARILALLTVLTLCAGAALADPVIDTVMSAGTAQAFTDEPVPEEDINTILKAGLAAASAINQQPWFFVAVTDREVMSSFAGGFGGAPGGKMPSMPEGFDPQSAPGGEGMPAGGPDGAQMPFPGGNMPAMPVSGGPKASVGDSPLAIVIYMSTQSASPDPSFDCGLAAQNMYIAAAALGYGVKIVSSPVNALNGENHDALCEKFGVDPSMKAVSVLLIGRTDTSVDAASGATTRSGPEEKTSIIR